MKSELFDFDILKKTTGNLFNPSGFDFLIGCDEAGRGPGAGALYTAAVCFKDFNNLEEEVILKLNDSKKLSEKTREKLFPLIMKNSVYSIKKIEIETIEKMNILNASLYGMKMCALDIIKKLNAQIPIVLVDGNHKIKDFSYYEEAVIKGDATSASVAAASILAKVSRDNYMNDIDKEFPEYNFKKNKGYLTKEHIQVLKKIGVCKYHRMSFLKNILNN